MFYRCRRGCAAAHGRIEFANFILIADANKVEDKTIGFNLRAWQQVRFNDTLDLTRKLVDSLEQHFELKGDAR
ncbi:hypothetical protein THIARS_50111 [Thiomonas delicata]|uniref:Uncharacterized protein n=1 Tax=Thiomonas delicata TaxID=364030 RepID=A0A238D0T2_THIDL|nr:hypothetical protein THIARS_50111 [Thiomonas delicata]